MSNKSKKLISFCLILVLILAQTNFAIFADLTIGINIFNKIDVAFAVGQTEVDYATFGDDLMKELSKKKPPVAEEDLNVIMGEKSVSTDSTSEFNWWTYDHAPKDAESGEALDLIDHDRHSYIEYVGNQSTNDNNSKDSHIEESDSGATMTFYGYGSSGYKDFKYLPNDQATKKTFEFSIEEGEAYDALDGVGFFFNTSMNNLPYGEGQTMSGYLLFLQYNTSGKGSSMGVYKFNDIDTKAFHHTNTNKPIASYSGFTKIATATYGDAKHRKFKVIAQPTELKMLYKESPDPITGELDETSDLVDWTQNETTAKKVTFEKPQNNGYGYGPMCGYRSHNCPRLTTLSLKDLTMSSEKVRSLTEVVREPNWRSDALKFIVNLNDNYIEDAADNTVLSELISRFNNDDIYYIGWGGGAGATSHSEILSKNNDKGIVVNTDKTTTYNDQIKAIADEIYERYYKKAENVVLTTDNVKFEVTGADEGTSEKYPNGKWKISHSTTGFSNDEGLHELNDTYFETLSELKLNKPGTYTISYSDKAVATITAHRKPVADFTFSINDTTATFTNTSTDPDERGALSESWQYQTSDGSTQNGKPTTLTNGKIYLVTLTVTDKEGASSSITKQVSLNSNSPPFADFEISPDSAYGNNPNSVINLVDKSYSLNGKAITSKFVLKKGDTVVDYTFNEGNNNVSTLEPGDYKLELTVTCGDMTSETVSRNFTIVADSTPPSASVDPLPGATFSDNSDVTITFSDTGGSDFKEQRVIVTNSTNTPEYNDSGWSEKSTNLQITVPINKVGKSYIHYQAWDNAENQQEGWFGPYTLEKQNVTLTFSVDPTGEFTQPDKQSIKFTCSLNTGNRTEAPGGTVTFKIGDNITAGIATVTNKKATLTYTPTIDPGKNGPYTLTATYSGDDNYKEASETISDYYLTNKTQEELRITGLNSSYAYGDTFSVSTSGGSGDGEVTYASSNTSVATVDSSGKGKIVGVGEFTITATKAGDTIFNEKSVTSSSVTANKKDVTITGVAAEDKEYDGSNTATIAGTPTLSSKVDGDNVNIVTGQAAFNDKNVGTDKTVTFSGFSLSGNDAEKYNLTSQPDSVTANITSKELTINIKIRDKNYDGLNIAEYEEGPTLVGVVENDEVTLNVEGNPTFSSVEVGKQAINLGTFSITGEDAGNYTLTQPSDIKAEIKSGFEPELDTHYTLTTPDSNGWYTTNNFVITAKDGFLVSAENTNGSWLDMLTYSDETKTTDITFYVRNKSTNEISQAVQTSYKKDNTEPTGAIEFKGNKFIEFLNALTFKFFFKESLDVTITGEDAISGVNRIEYIKRKEAFKDLEEAKNSDEWKNDKNLSNNSITLRVDPTETFFIYAKIVDNVGNETYVSSEGLVLYKDATQSTENITYTRGSKADVKASVNLNGNTIKEINIAADEGTPDPTQLTADDYTKNDETGKITFKGSYLDELAAGNYTLTVSYNPQGEEYKQNLDESDETDKNEAPATTTIGLTVKKVTLTDSHFTFTPPENLTYDGTEKIAKLESLIDSLKDKTITIKYYKVGENGTETEVEKPIDAGTYVVKITVDGNDTYDKLENFDSGWGFTINGKPAEDLSVSQIDQNYLYGDSRPVITIKDGEKILTEGEDYDVEADMTLVGEQEIKIKFKGNYAGEITQKINIEVDKSDWGSNVTDVNGVTHYVDDEGTTSVEISHQNKDAEGNIWMQAASDKTNILCGIDDSKGVFQDGSKFYVKVISRADEEKWNKYWPMVDENIRKSIEDEKAIIFLIGVTKPDGTEYRDLGTQVPVYVQIGDDWNSEKVKAYFISDSSDEPVDVKVIKRKPLNTNTEKYFAQLQLHHFSPYIVYNEKTENNLTAEPGSNELNNSSDTENSVNDNIATEPGNDELNNSSDTENSANDDVATNPGSNALPDENQDNPESLENPDTAYDSMRPILIASLGILLVLTVGGLVVFERKKKN